MLSTRTLEPDAVGSSATHTCDLGKHVRLRSLTCRMETVTAPVPVLSCEVSDEMCADTSKKQLSGRSTFRLLLSVLGNDRLAVTVGGLVREVSRAAACAVFHEDGGRAGHTTGVNRGQPLPFSHHSMDPILSPDGSAVS